MRCTAAVLLLAMPLCAQEEPPRFGETVDVERVLLDVRVLHRGQARRDLASADLRLTVDGREVSIESLQWVTTEPTALSTPVRPGPGRLLVLLYEKDLHGTRAPGFLRLLHAGDRLVGSLGPTDRAAVLSFDTHLRLWQDFTGDPAALRRALWDGVLGGRTSARGPASEPTLGDLSGAADAASMEQALREVGRALVDVPGAKVLVLVGGTLGHVTPTGVWLEEAYAEARELFVRSRTIVLALDTTDADHHTLDAGLQQVAADTGGFFARTHDFQAIAMDRVGATLDGYYVLSFVKPDGEPGPHRVALDLRQGPGEVLAPPGYVD